MGWNWNKDGVVIWGWRQCLEEGGDDTEMMGMLEWIWSQDEDSVIGLG